MNRFFTWFIVGAFVVENLVLWAHVSPEWSSQRQIALLSSNTCLEQPELRLSQLHGSKGGFTAQPDREESSPEHSMVVDAEGGLKLWEDPYSHAKVMTSQETAPDHLGVFTRSKLIKADVSYLLIRIEETLARDPFTGREILLEQEPILIDHIQVKGGEEVTESEREDLNRGPGVTIRKKISRPGMYLAEFPQEGLETHLSFL